jgi:hypothetical protein
MSCLHLRLHSLALASQSICCPAIQSLEIASASLHVVFAMIPTAHQDVSLARLQNPILHLQWVSCWRVVAPSIVGSLRGVFATRKTVGWVHSRRLPRQNGNLWVVHERSMPSRAWYGHTMLESASLVSVSDQCIRWAMNGRCCMLTLTFRDRHLVQDRSWRGCCADCFLLFRATPVGWLSDVCVRSPE